MPEAKTADELKRLRDLGDDIKTTFVFCDECGIFTQVEHEAPFKELTLNPCWRCGSTRWIVTEAERGIVPDGCNAPPQLMADDAARRSCKSKTFNTFISFLPNENPKERK